MTKAWLTNLLESHHFSNGQALIVIFSGNEEFLGGTNVWEILGEMQATTLRTAIPDGEFFPTLVEVMDDSSIWPSAIVLFINGVQITYPIMSLNQLEPELVALFEAVSELPAFENLSAEEISEQTWNHFRPLLIRGAGWATGLSSVVSPEDSFEWWGLGMDVQVEDTWEGRFVVFTTANTESKNSTYIWRRWWHPLENESDMLTRVSWVAPEVELLEQSADFAVFEVSDNEGSMSFRMHPASFDAFVQEVTRFGFAYRDGTTRISQGNQNVVQNATAFSGNVATSPTPNATPSVQPAGAQHNSGIVQGNVNVNGLAILSGIVQGDVNVPRGADVDITGIVQGMVRIHGGTARLKGTVAAAQISSGKIEVYGILQSPLHYEGGEVYYHPGSIIAP